MFLEKTLVDITISDINKRHILYIWDDCSFVRSCL